MDTTTRIINFDAVDYMDTMAIYPEKLSEFLEKGGVLAWGAVPNNERISGETADSVLSRMKDGLDLLEKAGVDRGLLTERMLITPACGCAGMTMEGVNAAYALMADLENITSKENPFV
jgi:hypothetical protein